MSRLAGNTLLLNCQTSTESSTIKCSATAAAAMASNCCLLLSSLGIPSSQLIWTEIKQRLIVVVTEIENIAYLGYYHTVESC